ncbi:MAG: tripartite tricarboxylate transporter TctB family protein [Methyloligellaceae bacterium]
MSRVQRDTIAYILILAFSIFLLVWAIPNYTPPYPGYGASPALVPIVSVAVIVVMAILALTRNALAKWGDKDLPPEESQYPDETQSSGFTQIGRINLVHLASFMVPCALFVAGIDYIGYLPAAFLFMLLIQYAIGSRKLFQPIVVAVAAVALMYVIMRYGFGVPIPGPQLF